MTEGTIRIVQSCSAAEAAAMVAAIRAYEETVPAAARAALPNVAAAGARTAAGPGGGVRKDGGGVLWTRSESSLGRGF